MKQGSLTIVGSGIKFMSNLTIESKTFIESADKVLYLVNEPAMKEWLSACIPHAESLENAYVDNNLRRDTYHAITQSILQFLAQGQHICVVLEGHPLVFAKPALDAMLEAKKQGYRTFVSPGISAEDYLFADLLIDPGRFGCQSYEATDFLIHQRAFDGYSHLILWQISVIGLLDNSTTNPHYQQNMQLLIERLNLCYPLTHEVVLYEGSQYPHMSSNINMVRLAELPQLPVSRITTLYLPPAYKSAPDFDMIKRLNLDIAKLRDHG
jgi:tetrapyrrole methylase family protein / MazG family protein